MEPAKKLFSTSDYRAMLQIGILSEDDRVELIQGEVVELAAIGSQHAACVKRLNLFFSRHLEERAVVGVQDPIQLDDFSAPEPDLTLLRPRDDFYAQAHPTAGDVLLAIEVGDTTSEYDREVKAPLYARSAIPELWLVDLSQGRIEVLTNPSPQGYGPVRRFGRGQTLSPQSFPDLVLEVDWILG